jgi:hypothetical protein
MSKVDQSNPFGNAPLELCVCPKCVHGDMALAKPVFLSPKEIEQQKSWCSKVYCEECGYQWYVCRECSNSPQRLESRKKIVGHTYHFHQETHPVSRSVQTTDVTSTKRRRKKTSTTNYPSSSGDGNEITNTTCPFTPSPKCDTQKSVVQSQNT